MSKARTATNFAGNKVVQHAKLPPRKRPKPEQLLTLIKSAKDVVENQVVPESERLSLLHELEKALAPFLRHANGMGWRL